MRKTVLGVAVVAVMCLAGTASAATLTWNVVSGNWGTAGSWIGGVPAAADTALFVLPEDAAGYTATMAANASIAGVTVNCAGPTYGALTLGGTSTLTVGAGGFTFGGNTLSVACKLAGAGAMNITLDRNTVTPLATISNTNNMTGGLTFTGYDGASVLTLAAQRAGGGSSATVKAPINIVRGVLALTTHTGVIEYVSTVTLTGDSHLRLGINPTSTSLVIPAGNALASIAANDDTARTLAGTVSIGAGGVANFVQGGATTAGRLFTVSSQITGGGKVVINSASATTPVVVLSATTSNWTGGLEVTSGIVRGTAANSLGAGAVTVSNGTLEITNLTALGAVPGAAVSLTGTGGIRVGIGTAAAPLSAALSVAAGNTGATLSMYDSTTRGLGGTINIGAGGAINFVQGGTTTAGVVFTVASKITGAGKVVMNSASATTPIVDLTSTTSDWSGGLEVRSGKLQASSAASLGGANNANKITVNGGMLIIKEPTALTGVGTVTVTDGGQFRLNAGSASTTTATLDVPAGKTGDIGLYDNTARTLGGTLTINNTAVASLVPGGATSAALTVNGQITGAGRLDVKTAAELSNSTNNWTGGLVMDAPLSTALLTLSAANSGGGTPGTKAPITMNQGVLSVTHLDALQNVSEVRMYGDSHFRFTQNNQSANLVFKPGNVADFAMGAAGPLTLGGTIQIDNTADAKIVAGSADGTSNLTIGAAISGLGRLVVDTAGAAPANVLTNTNTYEGGTWIKNGNLWVWPTGTLGSGAVVIDGAAVPGRDYINRGLFFTQAPTVTPPAITVNTGGVLHLVNRSSGAVATEVFNLSNGITLAGGILAGPGSQGSYGSPTAAQEDGPVELQSDFSVTAPSYICLGSARTSGCAPARDFTITGHIGGAGKLTVTTDNDGRGSKLVLAADNITGTPWSGGLEVIRGAVNATVAKALGTGAVVAKGNGAIRTSIDGAFDGTAGVSIQSGGTWYQNSAETKAVTIDYDGALLSEDAAKLTAAEFNPGDPAYHITLNKGALLNKTAIDAMNAGGFDRNWLAAGDSGYGVWLANTNAGMEIGNGILTGVPIRGLAATAYGTVVNSSDDHIYYQYTSTLTEAAGGTLGIYLKAASMDIGLQIGSGASLNPADPDGAGPLAPNRIRVVGPGVVLFQPGATYGGADIDIETTAGGWAKLGWYNATTAVFPAGQKITIKNGAAAESYTNANLMDGVNLDVEAGGVFRLDAAYVNITGRVRSGGVVIGENMASLAGADSTWTMDNGSHIVIKGNTVTAVTPAGPNDPYPGRGVSNFVLACKPSTSSSASTLIPAWHLYLNDNTRVVGVITRPQYTQNALLQSPTWATDQETYQVRPMAGSTKVTLAQEATRTLTVNMKVNANTNSNGAAVSGTLVIGDERVSGQPGTFKTFAGDWGGPPNPYPGLRDVVTTGRVNLSCGTNVMDAINIRSGTLGVGVQNTDITTDSMAGYLGNAKTIRVAAGATLTTSTSVDLTVNQTLSTVFTGGAGASAADRAYINLNSTTRVLTLKTVAGAPAGINPGDGALAGQLTFNSALAFATDTGANPMLTIDITGGGGAGLQPVAGRDHDQIVALGAVTGIGGANLTVNFAGGLLQSNFDSTDEFTILTTTSNLSGQNFASIVWNGGTATPVYGAGFVKLTNVAIRIPGDADLNGYVDLPDLIALARNWKVTPANWGQGDFDGDTIVDLPDLIILARNWHAGSLPPSAGGAVPEPASLALLALGGLALVRRRRP